jgi:hypothetical protein
MKKSLMNKQIDYPSIRQAYSLAKISPKFKSDWYCCIKIAQQQKRVTRLSNLDLERVSYHCLASNGIHLLKVVD